MRAVGARALAFVRSVVYWLWILVTVIPWGLVVLLASLRVRGKPLWWMAVRWLAWSVAGARVILGIRTHVIGMENIPSGSATSAILLVKHQSTFETFFMPTIMRHPLAYVFKKELLRVPFFGWAMGRLDMIHIDRSQRMQAFNKVVSQGRKLLDRGVWIIMFPECTRVDRGAKGSYSPGGARLAIQTGALVIPVAVTSAKCWPRKAFIKTPGTVEVSIGKPIPSQGREPDDLMREVEAWIESEMRRLDPAAYASQPVAPRTPS